MKPISVILLEEHGTNLNEMILEVAASIDKYVHMIRTSSDRNIRDWYDDATNITGGYHVFDTDITRERLLEDYSGIVRDYYEYKVSKMKNGGNHVGIYVGSVLFEMIEYNDGLLIEDKIVGRPAESYKEIDINSSVDDIINTCEQILESYRQPIQDDDIYENCIEEFVNTLEEKFDTNEHFEYNGVIYELGRYQYDHFLSITVDSDLYLCSNDLRLEMRFKDSVVYKLLRNRVNWNMIHELNHISIIKEFSE